MSFLHEQALLLQFSTTDIILSALVFIWTGFVRSGLGFGGAALGLPLMLFIHDQPLFWLPVIGFHLLFFSGLTLRTRIRQVDWPYLRKALMFIIPAAIAGVFGLLNIPNQWLLVFIYSITLTYGLMWLANLKIQSNRDWLDRTLLVAGGYVAGTSLTGAPLMVAVFMRHVAQSMLRNTLFVLWITLVTIKMVTFAALDVDLHFYSSLLLVPLAAVGHIAGLKAHDMILQNPVMFQRVVGGMLTGICILGLVYL